MHDATIGRIVRREEIVLVTRTAIDMTVCDEETGTLEVQVCIDVNPRILTDLYTAVGILLNGKLAELGYVVRRIVFGKPCDAAA